MRTIGSNEGLSRQRPARLELGAQALLRLALGSWLGSFGAFAFLIAPTAFRELPAGEAGVLVAPVLAALHRFGLGAGLLCAGLAWWLGRGRAPSLLALGLAILCGLTEFGLTPAIATARDIAFGPGASAEAGTRFASLHTLSRAVFGAVLAGTVALVVLLVRAEARETDRGM